jgi:glycine/D-amino acid oxidase-like deaminating enzyme
VSDTPPVGPALTPGRGRHPHDRMVLAFGMFSAFLFGLLAGLVIAALILGVRP